MTLRDIVGGLLELWQDIQSSLKTVFSENILDWPLWAFFVVALLILGIVANALSTLKQEHAANIDEGVLGGIWFTLAAFCFMSYAIFAAFTERHGLQPWIGFVGLISWPIFGYAFLLKLRRRLRK